MHKSNHVCRFCFTQIDNRTQSTSCKNCYSKLLKRRLVEPNPAFIYNVNPNSNNIIQNEAQNPIDIQIEYPEERKLHQVAPFPGIAIRKNLRENLIKQAPEPKISLEYYKFLFHFIPKSRSICVYDIFAEKVFQENLILNINTYSEETLQMNDINWRNLSSWIQLPTGEIFYCGGEDVGLVENAYLINLKFEQSLGSFLFNFQSISNFYPRKRHCIGHTFNQELDSYEIYVFGGYDKKCEKMNLKSRNWQPIANYPHGTWLNSCVSINNYIYIVDFRSKDFYQYDTVLNKFDKISTSFNESEGKILLLGGGFVYCISSSQVIHFASIDKFQWQISPFKAALDSIRIDGTSKFYNDFIYFATDKGTFFRLSIRTHQISQLI